MWQACHSLHVACCCLHGACKLPAMMQPSLWREAPPGSLPIDSGSFTAM